ncbi:hypothetical protein ATW7_07579 [Alteromonadales bacterium TW-7]|nr:hypothetical protein ATW7_07579 [Alteromonadales bacterium TW-7]
MNTTFKTASTYALVGLSALILSGCANKAVVSYGDAQAVETTDINFGSTDLQKVASQMTDSLLSSPVVGSMTQNNRPVVFVERIKTKPVSILIQNQSLILSLRKCYAAVSFAL